MSAYTHKEFQELNLSDSEQSMKCFFCGEPLRDTDKDIGGLVYWNGYGSVIALHQTCSVVLSVHLIQDARSLVSKTGVEFQIDKGRRKDRKGIWFLKKNNLQD